MITYSSEHHERPDCYNLFKGLEAEALPVDQGDSSPIFEHLSGLCEGHLVLKNKLYYLVSINIRVWKTVLQRKSESLSTLPNNTSGFRTGGKKTVIGTWNSNASTADADSYSESTSKKKWHSIWI